MSRRVFGPVLAVPLLAVAVLVGCAPGPLPSDTVDTSEPVSAGPEPEPGPEALPSDVERGAAFIEGYVVEHGRPGEHYELRVVFTPADAAALTAPFTLDVQGGSGHGGSLWFLRMDVGPDETRIERVTYHAYSKPPSGHAQRTTLPTRQLTRLLDAARALPAFAASRERRPDAPLGGSAGRSSRDFFVHVRALDGAGAQIYAREFAGYAGRGAQPAYLPIQAVHEVVDAHLEDVAWEQIPASDWRATHFPDAFRRNRDVMLRDNHWWVMERSVEALGWFGDRTCLDTLGVLRDEYPDPLPRQAAKIRNVLEHAETYLEGPTREIPDN